MKVVTTILYSRLVELKCIDETTGELDKPKLRKLLLEKQDEVKARRNFGRGTISNLCQLVGLEFFYPERCCPTCGGKGRITDTANYQIVEPEGGKHERDQQV